jgi:sugar phosphate isomerase/epimerase
MENERWIYGNIGERCLEVLESVNSPSLRLAFDPQNFLAEGEMPFTENFEKLAEYIAHVHIKDGKLNEPDTFLYAGTGDGQIRELLRALKSRDFDGFLSLEPHLGIFGEEAQEKEGRIRLFREALNALKDLVREVESE